MIAKMNKTIWVVALVTLAVTQAQATVWPLSIGGMKHSLVFWDEVNVGLSVDNEDPSTLDLLNDGELHTAPSDVLDGKGYNNQPGFLNGEAFSLPEGAVWVEVLSITPGLETYEGGMRSMAAMHTYVPILSNIGDRWMWNQSMHHPWYAAQTPGDYSVEYRVYVGDDVTGDPLAGYVSGTTQFNLTYAPEPGSIALLLAGTLLVTRRRSSR